MARYPSSRNAGTPKMHSRHSGRYIREFAVNSMKMVDDKTTEDCVIRGYRASPNDYER